MKTEKNIWIAFILNLLFSLFEMAGGIYTGSAAIAADALHDLGDALGIGISWALEKKSRRKPDGVYTYGYGRFSVLGGLITATVLILGAVYMIGNGVVRIFRPVELRYNGMMVFAVVGVCVNAYAAWVTHGDGSFNQKAVNLHMLEDVLGWVVVLIGAVVMRFTKLAALDPILSIGVSAFILIHGVRHFLRSAGVFLEKAPGSLTAEQVKQAAEAVPQIRLAHHIHLWSLDGQTGYATLHIVTQGDAVACRQALEQALGKLGIHHMTVEVETGETGFEELVCEATPLFPVPDA